MAPSERRRRTLTERRRRILSEEARYGLLDAKAIYLLFFDAKTVKACEREITLMLGDDLHCSYPLIGARRYYSPSSLGMRLLDLSDRRAGSCFAAQGLASNYAIMSFCLHGPTRFTRLTRPEFEEKFPALVAPKVISRGGYRSRYYLDTSDSDGTVRLALFVLDFGSRLRRLQRKVRREVQTRIEAGPAWKAMTQAQLFSVTVLVFNEQKASRVRQLFKSEPFHVRVVFVPGVSDLLP